MIRGKRIWFTNRAGIEPVGEGNDLIPHDHSETVPPEAHWWAFGGFCVHTPCENEFVPIEDSHFCKEMLFFSFFHQVIEASSAQQTLAERLPWAQR